MPNSPEPVAFHIQLIVGPDYQHPEGTVLIDASQLDMQDPEHRAIALGQVEVAMARYVGQKANVKPS